MTSDKIRVLLVDDHAVVRKGLQLLLMGERDIAVVGEAETVQEAMRHIREQDIDVALVDIAMTGKNGLELLKMIKAEKLRTPVLMLSMYSEDVYATRALRLGAAGYLTKNCPFETLVAAVRRAASGRKYISDEMVEKVMNSIDGGSVTPLDALTDRELEIMRLIVSGFSLTKIGDMLHLSPKTVSTHRMRILEKTGVCSNVELARYAVEQSVFDAPPLTERDRCTS